MFNSWFGKGDIPGFSLSEPEKNGSGNHRPSDNNEQFRRPGKPIEAAANLPRAKIPPPSGPQTFEQIYETAAVKPPKMTYGIQKVAEMSASTHLEGMSPGFKQGALLMALEAAGTDVREILNDLVTRQRALKEYEEIYLGRVTEFELAEDEQNALEQVELDKIVARFKARLQTSQDEVARRREEFRAWQKSKRQELQRFTEAVALCVPQETAEREAEESDGKVTAMLPKAVGAYR
jgi:hypothetical protein